MEHSNDNTAAVASIEDVADRTVRADAQVRKVMQEVMAQRRSVGAAFDYLAPLSPGDEGELLVDRGIGWTYPRSKRSGRGG